MRLLSEFWYSTLFGFCAGFTAGAIAGAIWFRAYIFEVIKGERK